MTPFDLTGRKAFVTGASRGIGQAIAVALAQAGADLALVARGEEGLAATAKQITDCGREAHVIAADVTRQDCVEDAIAVALAQAGADLALVARGEEGLAATAKQITDCGREAHIIAADVTRQDCVEDAIAAAIRALGHVDIVVNNAGGSNFAVPFLDLRLAGWDKLIRLNLDSAMYVCHAIGDHLVGRGKGSVINVASVAGLIGSPFLAPYGAAKAGLISLTKTLAVEWAARGVRVNALCPGWTATDLNRNLWDDDTAGKATVATVPMQRWGRAEEMTGPAVFLASDASSYMTGQVLVVDGGQTALS